MTAPDHLRDVEAEAMKFSRGVLTRRGLPPVAGHASPACRTGRAGAAADDRQLLELR